MMSISLVTTIILMVMSFFFGIALTLLIQLYLFNKYLHKLPLASQKEEPIVSQFHLPKILLDENFKPEPAKALTFVLQFLFQECRNTDRVRRWFRTRLSIELEELLTRTKTGKLFEAIALRELNLGTQFPNISNIEVKQLKMNPTTGLIDDLELCLDLEYRGGFQLTIDANMRLNKTARVSVKVSELKGCGCLRFTRHPYTHWAFSFYSEPQLQLDVESQFQGRTLAQVNNIIASQIRKALKRKHILPNYKIRYKPFFNKSEPGGLDEGSGLVLSGSLEVTVLQVSRVTESLGPVFCSLAVDSMAWVEMVHSESGSYLTVDTHVLKQGGSLGVQFRQEFVADKYQVCFVVESVGGSVSTEVRAGDILVAVDGKAVTSLTQIGKFVKQAGEKVPLRLERRVKLVPTPPTDDKMLEISGLRHRRGSGDKSDSDSSNTPSLSDSPSKKNLQETPEHKVIHRLSFGSEFEQQQLQVFTSKELPYSQILEFNEQLKFEVLPEHKFLNLSVWNKGEKNSLLGHISLPLSALCISTVGRHLDTYSLLPPHPHLTNNSNHRLSSHNGFEPCLCYGDVLLSTCFIASQVPLTAPLVVTPSSTLTPPSMVSNAHDFGRTHFTRATQCGFCFKKIWLKDAFQCRSCAMTCHKKCVSKCLAVSSCGRRSSVQPEIVTTAADDAKPEQTSIGEGGTLFSLEGDEDSEVSAALKHLLSQPHNEELMDQAKASGRLLYADLPPDARKQRIDALMTKLNSAIDEENRVHLALEREEQSSSSPEDKARLGFQLGKSEEKLQALTVLMLHCCSGLQDSHDNH